MAKNTTISGTYTPTQLQRLHYGSGSVRQHLIACLPNKSSKAFLITGSSLATKTPLITQVEELLGQEHHAGTYTNIGQHAPVAQLDEATAAVARDASIDTLISIGGGSPIDSAKAISYRQHEKRGTWLYHIAVPTTLSAAECTMIAGYTTSTGQKTGLSSPSLVPQTIIYDSTFALYTPPRLLTSTGIRALDHAVELLYHPQASEIPAKALCLSAIEGLFTNLPRYAKDPKDEGVITGLQLASYASLAGFGTSVGGGVGLSHAIGYALGSPYGIPHGITSCLTLAGVVRLKAREEWAAGQLARALSVLGGQKGRNDREDAETFADAIENLVEELGLETRLSDLGVGKDQVDVIATTATKTDTGDVFDGVKTIVGSLF